MRSSWTRLAFLGVTLATAGTGHALPSFARKHEMKCSTCHAIYPKLTPLGRRFKESGFRLPDDEGSWKELLRSFPGSVRGGIRSYVSSDDMNPTIGIFKPTTAGSGSSWLSFWADWPFSVARQELRAAPWRHYWVRVNDVLRKFRPDLLNVKGGRFELDLPFSQARTYNLFPYTPYSLTSTTYDSMAAPKLGVELAGSLGRGFRYSMAIMDGSKSPSVEEDSYFVTVQDPYDLDFYTRISKTFRNENRVAFFLYRVDNFKSVRFSDVSEFSPFPFEFTSRDKIDTVGVDVDWLSTDRRFNLYGLLQAGRNNVVDVKTTNFVGGFAQLDARLTESLTFVARYSVARVKGGRASTELPPTGSRRRREQDITLGLQWWPTERLKLAFEYRVYEDTRGDTRDGPRGAFAIDFIL